MLKEKIGQMLIMGFKGSVLKDSDAIAQSILNRSLGGVILFDYDFTSREFNHNIKSPTQVKSLTSALQNFAMRAAAQHQQEALPLLIGIDYEGGRVNRLNESMGFPATISAAKMAELPRDEARQWAGQMAKTLAELGINLNFAPVLDVRMNQTNPLIGDRSFSATPQEVIDLAAIFSAAFQQHDILYTYKHFPGHGSAANDSHTGFVDITDTFKQDELLPYQTLLSQPYGAPLVMTAHLVHRGFDPGGLPASLSRRMTQGLLRDQLHFQGVVITDDMQMKAITDHYPLEEAVRLAINAGADILIFGNQLGAFQTPEAIIDIIEHEVKAGRIAASRIEEACARVLTLKKRLNIKHLTTSLIDQRNADAKTKTCSTTNCD